MFLEPSSADAVSRRVFESPVGTLLITANDQALTELNWCRGPLSDSGPASPLLEEAARQLAAYFAGDLRTFDLPLAPAGSEHDRRVWRDLCRIPFGETITYGVLAARIGSVARAVGGACGANPIAIVIPCHRVVAAGGALGGFSGGAGPLTKRAMLAFEARVGGTFALAP